MVSLNLGAIPFCHDFLAGVMSVKALFKFRVQWVNPYKGRVARHFKLQWLAFSGPTMMRSVSEVLKL